MDGRGRKRPAHKRRVRIPVQAGDERTCYLDADDHMAVDVARLGQQLGDVTQQTTSTSGQLQVLQIQTVVTR